MHKSVRIETHAAERMIERGAEDIEVRETIAAGEKFAAKYGRTGFRRNFPFNQMRRGRNYATKQIEVFAVEEDEQWIVVTVLVKFF